MIVGVGVGMVGTGGIVVLGLLALTPRLLAVLVLLTEPVLLGRLRLARPTPGGLLALWNPHTVLRWL